jgi:hypothetical protein
VAELLFLTDNTKSTNMADESARLWYPKQQNHLHVSYSPSFSSYWETSELSSYFLRVDSIPWKATAIKFENSSSCLFPQEAVNTNSTNSGTWIELSNFWQFCRARTNSYFGVGLKYSKNTWKAIFELSFRKGKFVVRYWVRSKEKIIQP